MADALPLRDIHLPAVVPVWPPAIGWWLLAGIVAAALYLVYRHFRRNRVRRAALARLRRIQERYRSDRDEQRLVDEVSTLLRRVCLSYRPRRSVASLTGASWREALATVTRARGRLSDGVARQVCDAPYDPSVGIDSGVLLAETQRWVRALPPLRRAA